MRIAVFTNQFPGPVSTFFARDMRGLLEAGVELDIFSFYPLEARLWQYVPDILNESVLPKTKIHHISFTQSLRSAGPWPLRNAVAFLRDTAAVSASAARSGVEPLAKSIYVSLKAWTLSKQYAADYDHILAYWGNYAATCAYIFHRLKAEGIPYSMFLHAGIDLYKHSVYMREKLLYADNIITCSEFNREFMRRHYPDIFPELSDKIYVHHHGLDLAEYRFEQNSRPPRKIIAVGRPDKQKGFEYLLRATPELTSRGLDIDIEFVGPGEEAESLKSLTHELNISEKVRFRGWLLPEEVRSAIRQASVLAHPSSELWDGVPNVIKEAMALGTPVVASNLAGIPELLGNGENGILVPPKDVKALADAIEMLLRNDALRRRYADAARRHAEEKFDYRRNGRRLANILHSTSRRNTPGQLVPCK